MLLKDILKAKQEGKAVDIDVKGVDLRMVSTDRQGCIWRPTDDTLRVQVRMTFDLPSAEGEPLYDNLDVPEVSLSTKPKYDPCRKLRNKDRVRVKSEVNGRPVYITKDACQPIDPNEIWEVVEEKKTGWVHLKRGVAYADAWHAMLELVTPGEEVGPYSIVQPENYKCVRVMEGKRIHSSIPFDEDECVCLTLEQALAAAEAECDRLNTKWRKEQNNV